jgi:hypothetical protein
LFQEREECPFEASGEKGKILNEAAAAGTIHRFLIAVHNTHIHGVTIKFPGCCHKKLHKKITNMY